MNDSAVSRDTSAMSMASMFLAVIARGVEGRRRWHEWQWWQEARTAAEARGAAPPSFRKWKRRRGNGC